MRTPLLLSLLAATLCSTAEAHDILLLKQQPARAMLLDSTDGSIVDPLYMDIDGMLGFGGAPQQLIEAVYTGTGELWISNATLGAVHRFSEDGQTFLGNIASLGVPYGLEVDGGFLYATTIVGPFGMGIVKYDIATDTVVADTGAPVLQDCVVYNGELLVSSGAGQIHRLATSDLTYLGSFAAFGGGDVEQLTVLDNGNLLVALSFPAFLVELDSSGGTVNQVPLSGSGGPRGVAYLDNGDILCSNALETVVYSGGSTTTIDAGWGDYLLHLDATSGGIGVNYCVSTPNSTGSAAEITATGSASVSTNDFHLSAGPTPNQPGLFFYGPNEVQLPFGNGFRCVGGELVRLPVISAVGGQFDYQYDLTAPPSAPGQILAGSTWKFQLWFRDPAAGGAFFDTSDGFSVDFQP